MPPQQKSLKGANFPKRVTYTERGYQFCAYRTIFSPENNNKMEHRFNMQVFIDIFTLEEIKEVIRNQNRTGKILAEVVISTYFGKKRANLMQLDALDQNTFRMAIAIIAYRRTANWNDQEFIELANFAADQHDLKI